MSYASFEQLEIWQRACRLAVAVYQTLEAAGNTDCGIR